MLDRQTYPLEIARKVLKPETINDVRSGGYTSLGYSILDRWALNSPEELRKLEAPRESGLRSEGVRPAADGSESLEQRDSAAVSLRGMLDWEILESMGIDMNLKITK